MAVTTMSGTLVFGAGTGHRFQIMTKAESDHEPAFAAQSGGAVQPTPQGAFFSR